jgi:hypothetical protein
MATISDSLRTSAFEQNPTNAGATSPDAKQPKSNTVGNATVVDVDVANNRSQVARDAEAKWLSEVMAAPKTDSRKDNRIRLVSTKVSEGDGSDNTGFDSVLFYLSPEVSESKQAIYAEIGDIRQAASLLIYTGSPSRKWSVSAKFLSRTPEEADQTWKQVQLLRSWMNPDSNYKYGLDAAGTPHVLKLFGYGRTWQGIPVVLTSLNIEYPTDIDYIPTAYGTKVPVIQSLSFQLTEARTPDDLLEKFNLEQFKLGILPEW